MTATPDGNGRDDLRDTLSAMGMEKPLQLQAFGAPG